MHRQCKISHTVNQSQLSFRMILNLDIMNFF